MHLFFFVRGINSQVETWKTLAQSQFWRWDRVNLTTKKAETTAVQGALRPSILGSYEYIFPEECLPEVMSVFGITKEMEQKPFKLWTLRKLFGIEKIPDKAYEDAKKIQNTILINGTTRALTNVCVGGVGVYAFGIKKDVRGEMYGYEQEGL